MAYKLVRAVDGQETEICSGSLTDCRNSQMNVCGNFSKDMGIKVRSMSMSIESVLSVVLVDLTEIEYKLYNYRR